MTTKIGQNFDALTVSLETSKTPSNRKRIAKLISNAFLGEIIGRLSVLSAALIGGVLATALFSGEKSFMSGLGVSAGLAQYKICRLIETNFNSSEHAEVKRLKSELKESGVVDQAKVELIKEKKQQAEMKKAKALGLALGSMTTTFLAVPAAILLRD
jgi:hypothetical protein